MSYSSSASNSSTGAIVEDVERCKDNFTEHCLDGSLETSISDGGAGPQQTQSLVGVHDDGQLSTHPLQSKKQKTEAERCAGSICQTKGQQGHLCREQLRGISMISSGASSVVAAR